MNQSFKAFSHLTINQLFAFLFKNNLQNGFSFWDKKNWFEKIFINLKTKIFFIQEDLRAKSFKLEY